MSIIKSNNSPKKTLEIKKVKETYIMKLES